MSCVRAILISFGVLFALSLLLIGFLIYEEQSDIYRYADYGIILTKDDYFQSLGARQTETTPEKLHELLGNKASLTFGHLDRDGNGLLSASEIEPLIHMLKQNSTHPLSNPPPSCVRDCLRVSVKVGRLSNALFLNSTDAGVEVTDVACLREDVDCSEDVQELHRLLPPTADSGRLVDHRHFLAFLPRSKQLAVGRPFQMVDCVPDADSRFAHAPKVNVQSYLEPHERALAVILSHLSDEHVSLYPSSEPRCSVAVVRAKTADLVEVYFRLLVEFNGPDVVDDNRKEVRVATFTPGALIGRMVMRLADFRVVDFHLHQKTEIGVISMTHFSTSLLTKLSAFELKSVSSQLNTSDVSWTEAISPNAAKDLLREELYALKGLSFLSLTELAGKLDNGGVDGRPILLLVGLHSLFDQTCRFACPGIRKALGHAKVRVKLRYEFVLASCNHLELKKLSTTKAASPAMAAVYKAIQASRRSPYSLIVLKPDASEVLGRTSFAQLERKTAEVVEPHRPRSDVELEAEEDLSREENKTGPPPEEEILAQRIAQEKKIRELSSTSLLEFLDDALFKLAGR